MFVRPFYKPFNIFRKEVVSTSPGLADGSSKDVDERLAELKQRVDDIQAAISAAKKETHQQVQARIADAAATAQSAAAEVERKAAASSAEAKSRWSAFRSNLDAKKDEFSQRIETRAKEHDLKRSAKAADVAEDDAIDSIDFAELAARNAYLSVLDAIDARLYAEEIAAGGGSQIN